MTSLAARSIDLASAGVSFSLSLLLGLALISVGLLGPTATG
jgi:hypothetical protein